MQDDAMEPRESIWSAPAPAGGSVLLEGAARWAAGRLLARPWFDDAALFALKRYFFPVSRLWAAAELAGGDPERFWAGVPMPARLDRRDRVRRVLARFEERRAAALAIEAEWSRVFFGVGSEPIPYRGAVEAARARLRHDYSSMRSHLRFLSGAHVPRVRMAVAMPDEAEAIYGVADRDLGPFVALPEAMPEVEVSRPYRTALGADYWLRFRSPSKRLGDVVHARVHEPACVIDAPTVIFGHGICVEAENWQGLIDECQSLVRLGYRVIRPEAPWHGRRAPRGRFGGEAIIAAFPIGALDAITGAVQEWAVLAAWARARSQGPLIFAGSSLGAMTSQLAADRARDWPQAIRPDAMLLLTHTGDLAEAVIHGALSRIWASPEEVKAKGWTEATARPYFAALNPKRPPVMPPERIVSVLGARDVVLPFESGKALVARWGLPPENVFVWDRGHFSVPMTLIGNDAPLQRLAAIVADLRR